MVTDNMVEAAMLSIKDDMEDIGVEIGGTFVRAVASAALEAAPSVSDAEGYKHILHTSDGHKTVIVDDSEEHPFGDELDEGDRVRSIPLIPISVLQNIADKITALNRHPSATDEYWGGYADGRNDAWIVVQSVIDDLPETPSPEPLLSTGEMKAQAQRCNCHGSDDYCPCQNVPDAETRRSRASLIKKSEISAVRSAIVSPADTSPVFTVAQIIEKIKDYGQDSLPTSEYRLACDDLVEAFEALAAAPKEASHDD